MNDWVVETPTFEENLMNDRVVMLNQNGVNRVVEIIKDKDKEIERLNNIINELEEELDRGYRDLLEHELVPGRELITNIKNYLQELKGSE